MSTSPAPHAHHGAVPIGARCCCTHSDLQHLALSCCDSRPSSKIDGATHGTLVGTGTHLLPRLHPSATSCHRRTILLSGVPPLATHLGYTRERRRAAQAAPSAIADPGRPACKPACMDRHKSWVCKPNLKSHADACRRCSDRCIAVGNQASTHSQAAPAVIPSRQPAKQLLLQALSSLLRRGTPRRLQSCRGRARCCLGRCIPCRWTTRCSRDGRLSGSRSRR